VTGFCKHGNQLSGSTKSWESLYQLSDCHVFKNHSSSWSYKKFYGPLNRDVRNGAPCICDICVAAGF